MSKGDFMNIINIDLNQKHYNEITKALTDNHDSVINAGDSILVLEDGTKILVYFRSGGYLVQYLDNLL